MKRCGDCYYFTEKDLTGDGECHVYKDRKVNVLDEECENYIPKCFAHKLVEYVPITEALIEIMKEKAKKSEKFEVFEKIY